MIRGRTCSDQNPSSLARAGVDRRADETVSRGGTPDQSDAASSSSSDVDAVAIAGLPAGALQLPCQLVAPDVVAALSVALERGLVGRADVQVHLFRAALATPRLQFRQ